LPQLEDPISKKNTYLDPLTATTYIFSADMSSEAPTSESDIEARKKRGRSPFLVRAD
jgi:hypothetical protein